MIFGDQFKSLILFYSVFCLYAYSLKTLRSTLGMVPPSHDVIALLKKREHQIKPACHTTYYAVT